MANKRKRSRPDHRSGGHPKRQKISDISQSKETVIKEALLAQFYPQVLSLREYLLAKLPTSSKVRRRKILSVGRKVGLEADQKLSNFLDQTLIGVTKQNAVSQEERWRQWTTFSQKADDSTSFANSSGVGLFSQSEIVDFVIWLLFSKNHASTRWSQHLLCQGFRKDAPTRSVNRGENAASAIPGVLSIHTNSHVTSMKAEPWPQILGLMGKEGERMMINLLLDCGIFLVVGSGRGTYHQLSGHPLGDLQILLSKPSLNTNPNKATLIPAARSPSSITFVRNRMMHARAAMNKQGGVRFGLRHIHVLNRYPLSGNGDTANAKDGGLDIPAATAPQRGTIQVMMYIFPRQFGLHNVFTEDVDPRETIQPFKDYTLREDEINARYALPEIPKIPKRLRGTATHLVRKLQIQHARCPYKELLEHYCPVLDQAAKYNAKEPEETSEVSKLKTQISVNTLSILSTVTDTAKIPARKPSMLDLSTPTKMVSAFCRAVLSHILPSDFWGVGDTKAHNQKIFLRSVDRFIELRRFESFSLHGVSQGLKIAGIEWLGPPNTNNSKLSQTDRNKRWEIFHEFIYYVFDSILIPLIRTNFHVTESVHKSRLFYFRHDVWRSLAEPELAKLKASMFEEVKIEKARKILDSRSLGFTQVRLQPKETGVRPIMNLKRRAVRKGQKTLGFSINSVLAPVYNVFTFESMSNPERLGSSLHSLGDMYGKMKQFRLQLQDSCKPLYFAKLDVQAAFDTIPQSAILQLMSSLTTESEYRITKHLEIKPGENYREDAKSKPMRNFRSLAKPLNDFSTFEQNLETDLAVGKKNTVFIENIVANFRGRDEILNLLAEHVQRNMVKIGKKFYRQKEGIAQGSVVSSLLCNYFYADLEARHLDFLQSEQSLLLRQTDDFLLITTEKVHAKRFLQIMHDGLPAYGVRVNPNKTLVNFEVVINNKKIARLVDKQGFPFCGSLIDVKTLEFSRDRERKKDVAIVDSLTVEYSRVPGKTFHRKVLNSFKIQSHAMYLDTSYNSTSTVLKNIHSAFVETATKMWTYVKCLPPKSQPGTKLLIKTITDLTEMAFVLTKSKGKNKRNQGYEFALKKTQVEFLALDAFRDVLGRKQSKYVKFIAWLDERIGELRGKGIQRGVYA